MVSLKRNYSLYEYEEKSVTNLLINQNKNYQRTGYPAYLLCFSLRVSVLLCWFQTSPVYNLEKSSCTKDFVNIIAIVTTP